LMGLEALLPLPAVLAGERLSRLQSHSAAGYRDPTSRDLITA
jgi:hypothetical protein